MIRRMRSRVRTTLALLACVALTACSGNGSDPAPEPTPTPTSLAVEPQQPHVAGHVHLTLLPGLAVMTDDECTPEEKRRVCSADGAESWAPIGDPAAATLVEARTHLAGGHTSWTTVLRFAPDSREALRRAARDAAAAGGLVLVLAGDRVLAAVPASDVHGAAAVLADLDKATAWEQVAAFEGS